MTARLMGDRQSCRRIAQRDAWNIPVYTLEYIICFPVHLLTERKKGPSSTAFEDSSTFQSPTSATQHDGSEHGPGVCEAAQKPTHSAIPSNKAHPTITSGRPVPVRGEDVPEDVQRHNAEFERRFDRSYNKLSDRGDVVRGFGSGVS